MSITGIERLIYGVDNIETCTRYFRDFGLPHQHSNAHEAVFQLMDGAKVIVRSIHDPRTPESKQTGIGVREVVWGVDSKAALETLIQDLQRDRDVVVDEDGIAHFLTDSGLAFALRVFAKKTVINAPLVANAPGAIQRINTPRVWRTRACPKTINHVVFSVPDFMGETRFFCDRLGFRLSDYQHGIGVYLRADGSNNHHSLLALNASAPLPEMDGHLRFHHANYGVADIDELMVGVNHMERCGWPRSKIGIGRHRVDSALFCYLPCPAGGEAEYGADSDCVDDTWVPREWPVPLFAYCHWAHNLPEFLRTAPEWEVHYLTDGKLPVTNQKAD